MSVGPAGAGFKDLFSAGAAGYARFRPRYPDRLFAHLAGVASGRRLAVDVGAGNGQAAAALGSHFDRVVACEPSAQQLGELEPRERLHPVRARAEWLPVAAGAADLVLAAQAFHWFQAEVFFAEAGRVLRAGGVVAIACYQLPVIGPAVDRVVHELYGVLDRYWEPERRLVEEGYRSVVAPFPELEVPDFEMEQRWSLLALAGFLGTWSPLARYRRAEGRDPLAAIGPRLEAAWREDAGPAAGTGELSVVFPLKVRVFRAPSDP